MKFLKAVLVGEPGIGMTSVAVSFCSLTPDPNVIIFTETEHQESVCLSLWDVRSSVKCHHLMLAKTSVVVLCFALDSPSSFEQLRLRWLPRIQEHLSLSRVSFVVVGLRSDLRSVPTGVSLHFQDHHHLPSYLVAPPSPSPSSLSSSSSSSSSSLSRTPLISPKMGKRLAAELNGIYLEASSKTRENLPWLIQSIVRQGFNPQRPSPNFTLKEMKSLEPILFSDPSSPSHPPTSSPSRSPIYSTSTKKKTSSSSSSELDLSSSSDAPASPKKQPKRAQSTKNEAPPSPLPTAGSSRFVRPRSSSSSSSESNTGTEANQPLTNWAHLYKGRPYWDVELRLVSKRIQIASSSPCFPSDTPEKKTSLSFSPPIITLTHSGSDTSLLMGSPPSPLLLGESHSHSDPGLEEHSKRHSFQRVIATQRTHRFLLAANSPLFAKVLGVQDPTRSSPTQPITASPETGAIEQEQLVRLKKPDGLTKKNAPVVIEIDASICSTRSLDLIIRSLYTTNPIEVNSSHDAYATLPIVCQAATALQLEDLRKMAALQLESFHRDHSLSSSPRQEEQKAQWGLSINRRVYSLFYNQKQLSDALIELKEGVRLYGHCAILSSRSQKIRNMIPSSIACALPLNSDCELEMRDHQEEEESTTLPEPETDLPNLSPTLGPQVLMAKSIQLFGMSSVCTQAMLQYFYGADKEVLGRFLDGDTEACAELVVQSHKQQLLHLRNVAASLLLSSARSSETTGPLRSPRTKPKPKPKSSSSESAVSTALHRLQSFVSKEDDENLSSFVRILIQQIPSSSSPSSSSSSSSSKPRS